MTTARQIMTPDTEFMKSDATAQQAASLLASTGVGAVPVCEPDGHLAGMVTDRDIVIKVVAKAKDPSSVMLSELVDQDEVVTIGADDQVEEAMETMKKHRVRRLPVIDGNKVVGMVSQGDIARVAPPDQVGEMLAAISS